MNHCQKGYCMIVEKNQKLKSPDLAQILDFRYFLGCIDPIAPDCIIQAFVVPRVATAPVALCFSPR